MSSHALLLRLFLSSSFFSVHVALKYLLLYSDNIGITYYLTRRLNELEIDELRDVWGFICHLLVTRPSKSRAIECFVTDTAQRSTHIALITLWSMQAALTDLASHRENPSFVICQRVLHRCHELIFGDQVQPTGSPYSGFILPAFTRRRKIRHHAEPVFVGLGIVLAGAPAMPLLGDITGQVAIEQGRRDEEGENVRSLELDFHGSPYMPSSNHSPDDPDESESPTSVHEDNVQIQPPSRRVSVSGAPESHPEGLLSRRQNFGAQTLPALPLHFQTKRKPRLSEDPLGQSEADDVLAPYQSSPSLVSARTPARSAAIHRADLLLEQYDTQSQMHILRGNYFLSEVQFLLSLENICNRLVIVPKPARVSSLRAELTALNHKLPAEVCMPMWCTSSDIPQGPGGIPKAHHRIVRIPPGEAVVLNSAERAPFLLYIEVLNGDLDFDPSRRSNKEILRKAVTKEGSQKNGFTDSGLNSASLSLSTPRADAENGPRTPFSAAMTPTPFHNGPPTAASSTSTFSNDEEEVDLVEQLYGGDQPLRSKMNDIEDSIVLPPTPKNRELDMVAWARASPSMASDDPRFSPFPQFHARAPSISRRTSLAAQQPDLTSVEVEPKALSLDEYSERMRTAAIMLAQLNSDQGRDPLPVAQQNGAARPDIMQRSRSNEVAQPMHTRHRLPRAEASAIRDRIMKEMLALEEERMERMKGSEGDIMMRGNAASGSAKTAEDENIIRKELNKADPSAVVFSESWSSKKSRIRHGSPYGHLANWDCVSVIVKTGGDLRQEQMAVQLIREFQLIWEEEKSPCWVKYFRIMITGASTGLIETITDAVSIHSIKKAEYAKRLATGRLGHVTLMDHFISTYGEPNSAKFVRAQKNFAKSLAGYSIVTYLLQVKDRHNGNILLDRDGHLVHIDFGFMLSNTPGNMGFEAAPFKLPSEYVEVLGGTAGAAFLEFKVHFREGFEAVRKHCDRIITLVELMQKDSMLPCFALSGDQTANQLRDRFQPTLTHSLIGDYVNRLIDTSLGSHWTRLYDSYQYYSQSIL